MASKQFNVKKMITAALSVIAQSKKEKLFFPTDGKVAIKIGCTRETLYIYAADNPSLSDTLGTIRELQRDKLMSNGLIEDFNPGFTRFLLSVNHDMNEVSRSKTDITSNGETLKINILNTTLPDDVRLDTEAGHIPSSTPTEKV